MRKSWTSSLAGALLALTLASACTIVRIEIGSPLPRDPGRWLHPEATSMAAVLERFGPPNRILRHSQGDVFIYSFVRRHTDTLTLEEPVVTNFEIFTYSVVKEKQDRLVVLFDPEGIVSSYGYLSGTAELEGDGDGRLQDE